MDTTLLLTNAVVSTYADGTRKQRSVPANLSAPAAKDLAEWGGIVRHVLLLDPTSDIAVGDDVVIESWGAFVVDSAKRYRVFSVSPAGGYGLDVYRCVIGERVQR